MAQPTTSHPSLEHHHNAAAHHEAAAHHRREAAHAHAHGRHELAKEHSEAAHRHAPRPTSTPAEPINTRKANSGEYHGEQIAAAPTVGEWIPAYLPLSGSDDWEESDG